MPQVTVYVRQEDLAKWKAIEKKTEFIHNALNVSLPNGTQFRNYDRPGQPIEPGDRGIPVSRSIKTPQDIQAQLQGSSNKVPEALKAISSFKLCKHGYNPKFCKHAKPGKPCK